MNKEKEMKKSKKFLLITLVSFILLITLLLLYSRFIGTSGLIVNEYKITEKTLPNEFHGLKIVHLSDVHYGRIVNKKNIDKIIKQVNLIKPDIVVITGDLLDKQKKLNSKDTEILIENLKKINSTIGKYFITGNHDVYHNNLDEIIENGDFIKLDNRSDLIYFKNLNPILISGMSSNLINDEPIITKINKINQYIDENEHINVDDIVYKIMLMHEADFIEEFDYNNYNLILAGHSHNGQIRLPFIGAVILPEGSKKYYDHYYKLNNTELYISSGLGTSTYDFRLFNKPSFNLYRITNK